jgi:large subunit ribosomal protein L17
MRHRVRGRHLSRTAEHRRALARNLVAALFEHGRIRTTDAKAREVRPVAERMITLGKRGDLHARRRAARMLGDGPALQRLFGPIAERFAERSGGYTRMVKAGRRHGDAAPLAYLELLDEAPRVVRVAAAGVEEEAPPKAKAARGAAREAAGGSKPKAPKEERSGARASAAKRKSRSKAAGEDAAAKEGKAGGKDSKKGASGGGKGGSARRPSGGKKQSD